MKKLSIFAVIAFILSLLFFSCWLFEEEDNNNNNNNNNNGNTNQTDDESVWANLFGTWHAANYVQHSTAQYGYKNENVLKTVKAHYLKSNNTVFPLYPGEAVYSYNQSTQSTLPADRATIWYYGLGTNTVSAENIPAGGALLAFNYNTNLNGNYENVTVTGQTPPSRSIFNGSSFKMPDSYRIDAGDLFKRRGNNQTLTSSIKSGLTASRAVAPSVTEKKFWAQDATNDSYYELTAECLAYNDRCEVWVEKGNGITITQATAVANEYKDYIYTKVAGALSTTYDLGVVGIMDTMQLADYFGDENGRLILLLLDIRDGYVDGGGYVAGYFHAVNFFNDDSPLEYRSNQCDMIYLDIYPEEVGSPSFYETLAHEMQHLMNFTTSLLYIMNDIRDTVMDTWLDEGLSSAAEYLYSGNVSQDRVDWYNNDPTTLISQGDNFYLWGNYGSQSQASVLNDYATVNLFFQWLRVQFTAGIYKSIFSAEYSDYKAISSNFEMSRSAGNRSANSEEELIFIPGGSKHKKLKKAGK
ncbi:MAG: hypothetical protein FWB77_00490 [Treponema sp.]|nr:hypothetical protein [Treponema sp.]